MPEQTATELVPAAEALPEVRRLIGKLSVESEANGNEGQAISLSIMEQILRAENEQDLFAAQEAGTTSSKDFVNRPFYLREDDISWRKSAAQYREQGAFPFYAVVRVRPLDDDETEIPVVCGAPMVLATLSRLSELGGFNGYENGRPLIIVSKAAGNGDLLLLKPFALPKTNGNGKNKG